MGRAGVLPTLSLDFTAMGGTLDPRITFSRTSTATFINSSGYVEWAGANLFTRSNALNIAGSWAITGIDTPTTSSLAPNEDSAWRLNEPAATAGVHSISQSVSVSQGVPYTMSVLVKKDQRIWIVLQITGSTFVYFNSDTGAFGNTSGTLLGYDKQDLGSGWWRVWVSANMTTATASCVVYIASANGTVSYTSIAGYGLFVASPQLNPGSSVQAYYRTNPAAYHAPRFDYDSTLAAKGLLLEGPATNLLNWSETFATSGGTNNNWADTNLTRTSTNNTSPRNDATALRITASVLGNGTIISSAAIGTSASRVLSVWLRRVTGTGNIQYTLDNGSNYTTQAITSSWVRYSFPATTAAQRVGFRIVTSLDAIEIWGAQLETEASTSYIPTGASQVTRAVDTAIIAAGTNFSSWYTGGTTGTFVTEWCRCSPTTTQRTVIATSDVSNQHLHQYIAATTSRLRLADKVPAFIETTNASVDNSINKGAFSYSGSVQSLCLNGGTVVPGTLTFTTAPTWLSIGGPSTNGTSITDTAVVLNNSIRTIKYFPTRLSDGQIQGLTT